MNYPINIYINLCNLINDHHPNVKKVMDNTSCNDLFDINYDEQLIECICNYNSIAINKIMLINEGSTFVDLILQVFNKKTILVIHPLMLEHDFTENIFNPHLNNLCNHINEDVVLISNPSYPTGMLYTTKYISEMVDKHPNTIFIIDETYMDLLTLREKTNYTSLYLLYYPNIYIIRSFKVFGLNDDLSYVLSNADNISKISKIYKYTHIINISKIYAVEILKNINFYRDSIKNNTIVDKIYKTIKNNDINYSFAEVGVFFIKKVNLPKIQSLFYKDNIMLIDTYNNQTDDYIEMSAIVNS